VFVGADELLDDQPQLLLRIVVSGQDSLEFRDIGFDAIPDRLLEKLLLARDVVVERGPVGSAASYPFSLKTIAAARIRSRRRARYSSLLSSRAAARRRPIPLGGSVSRSLSCM
jgi:hypothetical protein